MDGAVTAPEQTPVPIEEIPHSASLGAQSLVGTSHLRFPPAHPLPISGSGSKLSTCPPAAAARFLSRTPQTRHDDNDNDNDSDDNHRQRTALHCTQARLSQLLDRTFEV